MGNEKRLLEGQYGLVTGASRGIGRAAAETLAKAGCNVALSARHKTEVDETAAEIGRECGVATCAVAGDVSDQAGVRALFHELSLWSGNRLDILVCNAGYPFRREIWETPLHRIAAKDLESWHAEVFKTDALGSVFCTYEALQIMVPAGRGSILFIASTPAIEGLQGTPYTMAKAGILGLMRDVANEYGKYNIRANALALGNIGTPATTSQMDQSEREALAAETPLKRWGRPEEVAQAILFMTSSQASFVTGQTLVVDGGSVRR